jgi:hypothetical protein
MPEQLQYDKINDRDTTKTRNYSLAAGIALTAIVIGLFLVLSGAGQHANAAP